VGNLRECPADRGRSKNGTVTLAGHVDSYTEKWQAERAVQRVSGVKGLAVEIDVKLPGLSKRTDGDIARSAQNILEYSESPPKRLLGASISDFTALMDAFGFTEMSSLTPTTPRSERTASFADCRW